ncbi:hypothetical protein AOQ84DRAFT_56721 [Glonium stellatum]|uniref:Uncharacterized protein n=1 Tax=Glonium stellatum TaxID=574774 RepID=A0A8E2EZK2_9PEZI|nr:hypothetical protein AOQ84DRAFT_56721 [Glonium stellatum]
MGATTLVTFLFESPATARTVELLGSWDNFCKSYSMKQDLRKGSCFWSGCYSFKDIICDGDPRHLGQKRSGGLKMGGTYWYYYRIDDGDEYHDPTRPSTTFCPLLPGQRLNVLEVPSESRSRSNSASSISSGIHTLDPDDKYLTPRPAPIPNLPKPDNSHSRGHFRKHSYPSIGNSAKSFATNLLPAGFDFQARSHLNSSHDEQKIKSSASSTSSVLKTAFLDFRGVREKSVTSLDTSGFGWPVTTETERGRGRQVRNARELQIDPSIFTSSTNERRNLTPLKTNGLPEPLSSSPVSTRTARGYPFSPLRCHPVDAETDFNFSNKSIEEAPAPANTPHPKISLSSSHAEIALGRGRASLTGSKRTNSPRRVRDLSRSETAYHRRSLSIGRVREPSPLRNAVIFDEPIEISEEIKEVKNGNEATAGMIRSSLSSLTPSYSTDAQLPPRQEDGLDTATQSKPLIDKELPALPPYLAPEPLFRQLETLEAESESVVKDEQITRAKSNRHFSLWANTSTAFTSPSLNEDAINSPTFSSLTTSSSDIGTPERFSDQFVAGIDMFYQDSDLNDVDDKGRGDGYSTGPAYRHEAAPPELPELLNSPLGQNLFKIDIKRPESASRRHAACFGFLDGFHGYSLPGDQSTSEAAGTKSQAVLPNYRDAIPSESQINADVDPTMSQLEQLMNDFGYLGEAVL